VLWVPLIRITGDIAKMIGYPVGCAGDGVTGKRYPSAGLMKTTSESRGTMDLSIVIVNYNTCGLLRDCLRSVYASEGRFDYEVIVVDNCSPDDSARMVREEFPQARLIASSINGGYAYANNLGLQQAQGNYLLLLNPDTVLPPTALRDMLQFMAEHPQAGVAGPKLVLANGNLDLACRRSFPTLEVAFFRLVGLSKRYPQSPRFNRYNMCYLDPDLLTEVDSVVGAFMLIRREALEQAGLLDESSLPTVRTSTSATASKSIMAGRCTTTGGGRHALQEPGHTQASSQNEHRVLPRHVALSPEALCQPYLLPAQLANRPWHSRIVCLGTAHQLAPAAREKKGRAVKLILLTNDDGVDSPGLLALRQGLQAMGETVVFAPNHNWSAAGHGKTMHKPLRIHEVRLSDGSLALSTNGAPVTVSLSPCWERSPDRQTW